MAVRLLAGPFEIRDREDHPLINVVNEYTWYPGVGLLLSGTFGTGGQVTYCATLDGIVAHLTVSHTNWSWWPRRRRLLNMDGAGKDHVGTDHPVVQPDRSRGSIG